MRAAGFSTDLPYEELVTCSAPRSTRSSAEADRGPRPTPPSCSATSPPASPRTTSSPRFAASAAARSATPARSTPSPPGCCSSSSGRATRLQRYLLPPAEDLRGDGAPRLALDHRRPRRRADRDRPRSPTASSCPTGRVAPAPADDLRRQGRRGAALPAGPPGRGGRDARARGRGPPRRAARAPTASGPGSRSSAPSGTYVRTLIETLGDAYCEELRRTAVGAAAVEDAGAELAPARGARLPAERASSPRRRPRRSATAARSTPRSRRGASRVRLSRRR